MSDRLPRLLTPRLDSDASEPTVVVAVVYDGLKGDQYDSIRLSPDAATTLATGLLMAVHHAKGRVL